ncbi:MAG TPA: hypothetical protein VHD56_18320, partial [Tepidisphaeraceae bacterium]|nr:hypothetical protein [Tepidisphaeraceae bacterium]
EMAVRVTMENRELIELLGTCSIKTIQMNLAPPPNAVRASINNCDVYIEDLIDADAEKHRIAKRREELTRLIGNLKGRMANESYMAKAPPHLVEQTKKQLVDAEDELKKLG